jgi:hypothetical protein
MEGVMQLLDKIRNAFAAVNEAEAAVNDAAKAERAELVSRSKTLGLLLLEAKQIHPKVADFENFLRRVKGLKLSRAYDLMKLAGGRITDEQLREDARERQRKSRAKGKKSNQISVTVTETPENSIEQRRAEMAALDMTDEDRSARALDSFKTLCHQWLPQITVEAHRQKARLIVAELTGTPKAEAA